MCGRLADTADVQGNCNYINFYTQPMLEIRNIEFHIATGKGKESQHNLEWDGISLWCVPNVKISSIRSDFVHPSISNKNDDNSAKDKKKCYVKSNTTQSSQNQMELCKLSWNDSPTSWGRTKKPSFDSLKFQIELPNFHNAHDTDINDTAIEVKSTSLLHCSVTKKF